ncbi:MULTISPECIES: hypothetical protein [Lysinibacillus]|uniref:Uncharacterized protein n=1 Tax=Lysinibacillus irui TaxID=2998077 RepID=A0AAJ5RNY8_9BACI|nr:MULTISPECIES: hypothetical protein [Lysinibacillus]MEA0565168.1 hypothetical protein [Lysinibacillus irui]WDV08550.1 hypothetical protein OU989_08735 [Lysinibacillus irui]
MKFNLGDVISTIVLLCMFLAIFFVMIHMIKKMKSTTPVPPPPTTQQQVEDLTIRVANLEQQVKQLADRK